MTQCQRCNGTGKLIAAGHPLTCSNCVGPLKYAGVGSRDTPSTVCTTMSNLALQLALRGWVLRSGNAKGRTPPKPDTGSADLAFANGCKMVRGRSVIRVATDWQPALDHAAQYHPNWSACDDRARALHARNSQVMLGDWFDDPVKFVLCWTVGGGIKGGTGQALRIAEAYNIPVFNLALVSVDAFWS